MTAPRGMKNLAIYVVVIVGFSAGIMAILDLGKRVEKARAAVPGAVSAATLGTPMESAGSSARGRLVKNAQTPLALLLLQVVVIVGTARVVGSVFVRFGQPQVVGEMLAGILLGPSFFGLIAPVTQAALFPASSIEALSMLSQIGVIVFMFVVGIDLDVAHLKQRSQAAIGVSHASIIVPFFLGTGVALFVYRELAPPGVAFDAFALFLGIAMSITAFPVLARILDERGLTQSALGATALACAAVDDLTAWCLLAVVVAIAKASAIAGALLTVVLSLVFVALMLSIGMPLAAKLIRPQVSSEAHGKTMLAGVLAFVFLCALTTEAIGIHALFGAFLAGVVMPPYASVREHLRTRLESFSSVFLLPLFFAFTGLRTQIALLGDATGWLLCLGLIAVAIVGKVGGTMFAARVTGMTWPDSFALGALMNTRGLVELIVLDLGYNLGILSARIFAMMVLMALLTTCATGPLLDWYERWRGPMKKERAS
ncbi:MAG: cation:proton antiporter [Acidobacteriota bacterium]